MRNDIIKILSAEVGLPAAELTPDMHLRGLNGMDSLQLLPTILKIEKTFGIEFPDNATFETVGEFLQLVESLAAQPRCSGLSAPVRK